MPASVWILNLVVLAVLLEADLARRKIGWFRVLRPLITAAAVVAVYLTSVPTSGHNLALEAVGAGVGILLGLAAHLFMSVSYSPVNSRRGVRDRAVSRAGFGYAAFWTVIFAGRLVFIYGSEHWFSRSLGQFLIAHQLSATGLRIVRLLQRGAGEEEIPHQHARGRAPDQVRRHLAAPQL